MSAIPIKPNSVIDGIRRCEHEIHLISSHPDIDKPGSAIHATMGQTDWQAEKRELYREFLASKLIRHQPAGFDDVNPDNLHPKLKDFQRAVTRWALMRGRSALFEGCGLGKTFQQLVWADYVCRNAGGNVLILAPLAVAEQTQHEAANKWGISVTICESQADVKPGINITNYEKLHKFNSDWTGIVLDESSILKSFDGSTKRMLCDFASNIPYRLACTATPSPNDYMELGNHAEFLGIMSFAEMLATFFVHDGGETSKWRLKGHANDPFWKWLATWAVCIEKPSDLGFSDEGYNLPELRLHEVIVEPDAWDGKVAKTLSERRNARRSSLAIRVAKCAEIALSVSESEQNLIWCDLNDESEALANAIPGSSEVRGSTKDIAKKAAMLGFANYEVADLVSKPSICGFGMNFQSCHRVYFVGLSDSWEQVYQAIRRCWRFGQTEPVDVYFIISKAEGAVLANQKRKGQQAVEMQRQIVKHMKVFTQSEIHKATRERDAYVTYHKSGQNWTANLGDCVESLWNLPDNSVHYSIYSPPFSSLYTYSNSIRDVGNARNYLEFISHYRFMVSELYRVLKPGRLVSFHCMLLPSSKQFDGFIGLKDFRGDLIRVHEDAGFIFHSEVTIWKNAVTQMQRTKALGLLHKQLKKDSSMSRHGLADYVVTMRKPGDNKEPVAGLLDNFTGQMTDEEFETWCQSQYAKRETGPEFREMDYPTFKSINIWQRYASPVWFDINPSDTLQKGSAREYDDERHICPLQLQVIERCIQLWTMPGDLILDPYAGIGSTGYVSLRNNRKAHMCELKESYFDQLTANLESVER
jgi:hypothetical protein